MGACVRRCHGAILERQPLPQLCWLSGRGRGDDALEFRPALPTVAGVEAALRPDEPLSPQSEHRLWAHVIARCEPRPAADVVRGRPSVTWGGRGGGRLHPFWPGLFMNGPHARRGDTRGAPGVAGDQPQMEASGELADAAGDL